ncbi:MAG: preprotein translocase subunit YajC [Deltaproteobacteria bacterium]|nr:preprotein translocase subunit YajC [Deltaproteobacteria bacterium]
MHILTLTLTELLLAQADPAAGDPAAPQGFVDTLRNSSMVPLLLMIAAMYFLMVRPMMKQNRQQQDLLKGLKKDDEVATSGGIYGRIYAIDERVVTLEIASGVRIKVLRSSIAGMWNAPAATAKTAPAKE